TYNIHNEDLANKIASNYCHACNRGRGEWLPTLGDEDLPYFFYYWLGDKVKEQFQTGNNFSPIMKKIYGKLEKFGPRCSCTNLYEGLNKDRFKQAKELFDYNYNYKMLLRDNGWCRNYCTNDKCDTLYNTAQRAYSQLSSYCPTAGGYQYCKEFNETTKKKKEYEKPEKLDCHAAANEVSVKYPAASTPTKATQVIAQVASSVTLPSEEEYARFNERNYCKGDRRGEYCKEDLRREVETTLTSWKNDVTLADGIVRNYDYACTKGGQGEPSYYDRCKFFYYWLGDKLGDSRSMVIPEIYKKLKDSTGTCKCTNLYDNITKERFPQAKILFDYYCNYKKLEGKNECNDYCKNKTCDDAYSKAESTYTTVNTECHTTQGEPYCNKFKEEKGKEGEFSKPKELPKQTCTPPLAPEPARPSTSQENLTASDGGVARTAKDSPDSIRVKKVGTDHKVHLLQENHKDHHNKVETNPKVHLPLVLVVQDTKVVYRNLVLQYNLLPPGLKNFFGGSSTNSKSNRRRRTVERDFDSLMNDSTDVSTVHSTTDSTDNSTIYDRSPPSGRRKANNRRNGQHRNNIAYQRM
ncbi:KIR protein, partial [Plasmodium coatneyi]